MTVMFDDAFRNFLGAVRAAVGQDLVGTGRVVVVRDLTGRLRLALQHAPKTPLTDFEDKLRSMAGAYFAGSTLIADEMLAPDSIFESDDAYSIDGVTVVERLAVGAEWTRFPLPNEDPRPPRATLYGIKGGVGRSTALCAWARHLATGGRRVLVVDLDLESPGVSTTLLAPDSTPEVGAIDWLVEDAVGNPTDDLTRRVAERSPLAAGTTGEILVVPCGHPDNQYLSKLARAYLDVPRPEGGTRTFASRLASMLDELEKVWQPDVVLLDSRAGLHDIAGIATTRLGATTFLFAVGSRQTWDGYRILLQNWMRRPAIAREVRDRLRVVAAAVPETGREQYLDEFLTNSYDVFADSLYEEVGPKRPQAFNFDVKASDAPHFPLPIYWSRPFQDWDPLSNSVTPDQISSAFGPFLEAATDLVLESDPNE